MRIPYLLIRLYFIFLMGGIHLLQAQQNLFNVPSSDITIKSKPFFQQQINMGGGLVQLNTTFCWGLGHEAEIGINILGVDFNANNGKTFLQTNANKMNPPVYPFYTINFQKAFTVSKAFKLAIGTQTGLSQGSHFGNYTYANLVTVLKRTHSKIISGLYFGTDTFLGSGDRNPITPSDDAIGFQTGIEQEVIKEKLLLLAEHITGKHSLGVSAIGLAYFVTNHWAISSGFQISNSGNSSSNSIVLEFTYVPSIGVSKHIYRKGHHNA